MAKSAKKQPRQRPSRSLLPRGLSSREGLSVVRPGTKFKLAAIDPGAKGAESKEVAAKQIDKLRDRLGELQEALYAEHKRSLLVVIQAMDTGGKDGAVKNLCRGIDPNGLHLTNFKFPTPAEFDHDFLWRVHHAAPAKGMLGIWNRSHYEDVLVPHVHRQISDEVWRERCEDINGFERLLMRNGTTLLKFFLHISKAEQKERLEARLRDSQKLWKFNTGDLKERARWTQYQNAYTEVIGLTATKNAPWYIVAANQKWSRNLVMLETVVATLEQMKPRYPTNLFDPKKVAVT
jgi:PPK2 family polyphosphate:nucleotide phosphotransferase